MTIKLREIAIREFVVGYLDDSESSVVGYGEKLGRFMSGATEDIRELLSGLNCRGEPAARPVPGGSSRAWHPTTEQFTCNAPFKTTLPPRLCPGLVLCHSLYIPTGASLWGNCKWRIAAKPGRQYSRQGMAADGHGPSGGGT